MGGRNEMGESMIRGERIGLGERRGKGRNEMKVKKEMANDMGEGEKRGRMCAICRMSLLLRIPKK